MKLEMKSLFIILLVVMAVTKGTQCSGDITQGRPLIISSLCTTEYCPADNTGNTSTCDGINIGYINDNNLNTSWISNTSHDLILPVTITLNLQVPMLFYDLSITWSSPTPSGMVLERSGDNGTTWTPYRYWSTDCQGEFGLPSNLSMNGDTQEAICTDEQLDTLMSGAQVTFSTYLSSDVSSQVKFDYQTITNLRLNLTSINTSAAPLNCSHYFAISELYINGSCACNGNADSCSPLIPGDNRAVYGGCNCTSNTEGTHCQYCTDGYWNYGIGTGCSERCSCNEMGSLTPSSCSVIDGQCTCISGVTGRRCNRTVDGYYFRALDDIRMEGEDATELTPEIVLGDGYVYTGRGYGRVPATGANITFTTQVDKTSQYKVVIRYNASNITSPVTVTITSLANVIKTLQCIDSVQPVQSIYTSDDITLPDREAGYIDVDSLCFQEGIQYSVFLSYLPLGGTGNEWLLDSIYLTPDVEVVSVLYSPIFNSFDYIIEMIQVESCLPNNADTIRSSFCNQVIFNISVEFYDDQVFVCGSPNPEGVANSNASCDHYGGAYECLDSYIGTLCDECANGYYNNTSVNKCMECPFNNTDCTGCACSDYGACTGSQCTCPYGVTGDTCDVCINNYYGITQAGCLSCDCNERGSTSPQCDLATGQCPCVDTAMGLQCNECTGSGYYMTLGEEQPFCEECFCFGHTQDCTSDSSSYILGHVISNFSEMCLQPNETCLNGWSLIDGELSNTNGIYGLGYYILINPQNTARFVASDKFHGDFHLSYGHEIVIQITYNIGPLPTLPTYIWLSGSLLAEPLVSQLPSPSSQVSIKEWTFTVPLKESYWRVGSSQGNVSTQYQLVGVLSNITDIRFSAKFRNSAFEYNSLKSFGISLLQNTPPSPNNSVYTVELCTCPTGLTGQFCDQISHGYFRSSLSSHLMDLVELCNCNNRSLTCHNVTGICTNCNGNTTGDNCEVCLPGYYDNDPTDVLDCQRCMCPGPNISHSTNCSRDNEGTLVCGNCTVGYTGDTCQRCDNGFYGNATEGTCERCQCHGNSGDDVAICDYMTGECLSCINNRQGFNCSECVPGYYGNVTEPCKKCSCNENGTESSICNATTGVCDCRPGAVDDCSNCVDGMWGAISEHGCINCDCCINGTMSSTCHQLTGQCDCVGMESMDSKCCECSYGFYNFTDGCTDCSCGELSLSEQCNDTGHCMCSEGGMGDKCNECQDGMTNNGTVCVPCHDCYFKWDTILSSLHVNITFLATRIRDVLLFYEGYTLTNVTTIIHNINTNLSKSEALLNSVDFDPRLIEIIIANLTEANQTYINLLMHVANLQKALQTAKDKLDAARDYVNSTQYSGYQGYQTDAIYDDIVTLNNTLKNLQAISNSSYSTLLSYQDDVIELIDLFRTLQYNASLSEEMILDAWDDSMLAESMVNTTRSFMMNISSVTLSLNAIQDSVSVLYNDSLQEANISVINLVNRFNILEGQANDLTHQLTNLTRLAVMLHQSADRVNNQSFMTLDLIRTLMSETNQALLDAQSLLEMIEDSQERALNGTDTLTQLDTIATNITSLPLLPGVDYAVNLSSNINNTIIPADDIERLINDANTSVDMAMETLSLAQNASTDVDILQSLVHDIINDFNETNLTLTNAMWSIVQTNVTIQSIDSILNEVNSTLQMLPNTTTLTETLNETLIQLMEGDDTVDEVLINATDIHNTGQQLRSNITGENEALQLIVNNVSEISDNTSLLVNDSKTATDRVLQLQERAIQLNDSANVVNITRLKDLLSNYQSKVTEVRDIRSKLSALQSELTDMTQRFKEAGQRYKNCYKTP